MAPTSAVFFDVANTLLHKPGLYPAISQVLGDAGIGIPEAVLASHHRFLSEAIEFPDRTSRAFYGVFNAQLLRSLGVAVDAELLDAMYQACSYLPWAPFDDVVHLSTLRQPLGVLSNWDITLSEKLTGLTGLSFRWILGSQDQQLRKPDPAFFAKLLDCTQCAPEEVVFVGDSVRLDVEPALRLGIRAYLIDRNDSYPHGNLPRLRSLAELDGVL
jgi:Predicted hydrolase (HAD superfamily)